MALVFLRDVLFLAQYMHNPPTQTTKHPHEAHPFTPLTKPLLDTY